MDKLMAAIDEYNKASAAWDNHKATFYSWWEMDAPMSPGERRADEDIQRRTKILRDRVIEAQAEVIAEAQRLRLSWKPERS